MNSILQPKNLKVDLLPHQIQAVEWMLKKEKSINKGGILADDMGLGKTISSLAMILLDREMKQNAGPTLVVAPLSLLKQWESEIKTKVTELTVGIYHGEQKNIKHDVIITSYGVVSNEYNHGIYKNGKIFKVNWRRIILDEAHIIKEKKSNISKAISFIKSRYRWCLTGTPLQNNLEELYTYCRFLKVNPFDDWSVFQRLMKKLKSGSKSQVFSANDKIKTIIDATCLRRSKNDRIGNEPILVLPNRTVEIEKIQLSNDEQEMYDIISQKLQDILERQVKSYAEVFTWLTRLRQLCCHSSLVFCESKPIVPSTKMNAIMNTVNQWQTEAPDDKIIIFSQFTSFINIFKNSIPCKYLVLQGSNTICERQDIIQSFNSDPSIKVLVISLKCGSLGLNLVSANRIILSDLWWNPCIENQAIDRCHRFGQEKNVVVKKIVTMDTIEDRIIIIQEKKQQMINMIFDGGGSTKLSLEDLKILLMTPIKTDPI